MPQDSTPDPIELTKLFNIQAGNKVAASVNGNAITIGLDTDAITAAVLGSAVRTINGVFPGSDGSFYLYGSDCDSWGYIENSRAMPMNEEILDENGVIIDGGTASGIWITDLCPACQTCDTVYEIKQELEQLEVLINMIKDVELHNTAALESRKEALEGLTIEKWQQDPDPETGELVPNCLPPWQRFDPAKGMQLLQQYITVAHMWNYAVMQNNASFKLEIAPEDTAGFVIQTKRSLPNCDNDWHIKCEITIDYDHATGDDGNPHEKQAISVYIPAVSLRFKPFNLEEPATNASGQIVTAEEAALDGAKVTITPGEDQYTSKLVATDKIVGRVAGTYELTVKILPFIYFEMRDKNNKVISVRGGTINITGQTIGDSVYYDFAPARYTRGQLANPTLEQYLNSKTAPTASVPFYNIWRVHVKWEIGSRKAEEQDEDVFYTEVRRYPPDADIEDDPTVDFEKTGQYPPDASVPSTGSVQATRSFVPENCFQYEETRLYKCTGVREPNQQAIVADSTIPVDIVNIPDETEE